MIKKICNTCNVVFNSTCNKRKFCSRKCFNENISITRTGENHPRWTGTSNVDINCLFCHKTFTGNIKYRKFCSPECGHGYDKTSGRKRGENNGTWKGGTFTNIYKFILKPKHPNCNSVGYIPEHRYIMSEHIGRPLKINEEVHHINGNKLDNRIENLQLLDKREHSKITCLTRPSRGTSKHKGVSFDKKRKKWQAGIVIKGKRIHAKRFDSELEASQYYQSLFKKYYGDINSTVIRNQNQ